MTLLAVKDLRVRFPDAEAVSGLSFSIGAGESVGLAGESGSGKTQTALAVLGLNDRSARVSGSIVLDDIELIGARQKTLRAVRARRVSMVFQDPLAALNPYRRVGDQLDDIVVEHKLCRHAERRRRVLELLERTGLTDPERQAASFPHQLSGGMRQRVMIAAALVAQPKLLIADEATTALDATLQAQILALLEELRRETGVSLLFITHDLGVIAQACDRLLVLHKGRIVEEGLTRNVFREPRHPQTERMLAGARGADRLAPDMLSEQRRPLLNVAGLSVDYPVRRGVFSTRRLQALKPLDVTLRPGETLAVIGESGSGKTSLARAVLGLVAPATGTVSYVGDTLAADLKQRQRSERRHLQLVFQDPAGSLNPSMRVAEIVAEPLAIHRRELDRHGRAEEVSKLLERVGLEAALEKRYPHQLSGGQAQRVAIARALACKPSVLICDEAVAALDVSVRQDILRLLADEQRRSALSILFIAHDLAVVRQLSHRVLVLYMGQLCEIGQSEEVFSHPKHPYTRGLIDSVASVDPRKRFDKPPVMGEVSSLLDPPAGCVFHPRCRYVRERCKIEQPSLGGGEPQRVACWRADELDLSVP